ncbi:MAG: YwaF family protein [Lachnospiraceae bacterium]|nr:YwaF family protein [Lachnospiraceae bacterium]
MTDSLFWIHRDQIYAKGLDLGFSAFSAGHLIWLAAIAVSAYMAGRLYRSLPEKGRADMRGILALATVLLEAAKVIVMGLYQVNTLEFIPLHLCSVGGLSILIYALWPGRWKLDQLFGYAFFPAALLAVAFPSTGMYPWLNFYCIHTFVYHALIICFFVMLYMSGEFRPTYRGLLFSFAFVALFAVPIYLLDGAFRVNYMFIGMRSDVGLLQLFWDKLAVPYGRPVYTLVLGGIFFATIHVLHLIYVLMGKVGTLRKKA